MAIPLINILIDELTKQLGDRHFYTIHDLHAGGLFKTKQSARNALKNGKIAHIKISPRRTLIPRSALVDYLRDNIKVNFSSTKEELCQR